MDKPKCHRIFHDEVRSVFVSPINKLKSFSFTPSLSFYSIIQKNEFSHRYFVYENVPMSFLFLVIHTIVHPTRLFSCSSLPGELLAQT